MLFRTDRGYLLLSETPGNMLLYEIFVSNLFQQLFGIFFLLGSLSCASSPPFQTDCVTCRNVELKGPEFLQQEFVLEASELEGEETGSPPRASAGLSHPFSKLQPGQLMSWAKPASGGGRDRQTALTSSLIQHRFQSWCLKPHLEDSLGHRPQ